MYSPHVTVIIATYNWSNVLPYAIGSVLGQTMQDFELLVVGDGCTDDSEGRRGHRGSACQVDQSSGEYRSPDRAE